MLDYTTRRYIVEYRAATDNEIATDLLFLQRANKKPESVGFIPRVPLWLGRFPEKTLITQLIALFATLWRLTVGLPFHLLRGGQLLWLRCRLGSNESSVLQNADEVGLALSSRAVEVVKAPEISAPEVWIVPPWVNVGEGRRQDFSLLHLVGYRDIALAVKLAVIATWAMGRDAGRRKWILQTYTAVPWFLVRIALSRLDVDFVMAEHFDRWAVLVDMTVRAGRRTGRLGRRLTLVQHGYIGAIGEGTEHFVPPCKLSTVTTLYVYDDAADRMFRSVVLTSHAASGVVTHLFKPVIALTLVATDDSPRVLFVGHPLCADLQLSVLDGLHGRAINAFYKPHPLAGLPASCRNRSWKIIEDNTLFPVVDLVVSYRSTLVSEYENVGIRSVVHGLTNETDECSDVVTKIMNSLPR